MEEVDRLINGPRQLHLFDALHEAGLPRALFLANMGDATIRGWYELSKTRQIINSPGGLPDLETIRDRTAQGMAVAGMQDKLAVMVALADPLTEEGQELLLKLAALQTKLLPKVSKVTKDDTSAEEKKMREEIKKLQAEREKVQDMHDQATDANFEPRGDGD